MEPIGSIFYLSRIFFADFSTDSASHRRRRERQGSSPKSLPRLAFHWRGPCSGSWDAHPEALAI